MAFQLGRRTRAVMLMMPTWLSGHDRGQFGANGTGFWPWSWKAPGAAGR